MVETKKNEYWLDMAREGEINDEITIELSRLQDKFIDRTPSTIFQDDTQELTESFESELRQGIQHILCNFHDLSEKDAQLQEENSFKAVKQSLFTIHIQKALSEITFLAFPLYKFMEAFSGLFDEVQFEVTSECITVKVMDPSRICLLRVEFNDESFTFYQEGSVSLNLNDLKKACYCQAGDKSTTTLTFGKERLYLSIHSQKYETCLNRTLEAIDLEIEEPPMEMLLDLEYPIKFSLKRAKFDYMLKNSGIYSEILEASVDLGKIIFQESGELGSSEITWEEHQLKTLKIDLGDAPLPHQIAGYSLSFMSWIGKMSSILDPSDCIQFGLQQGDPLRSELIFSKLGKTSMLFFLAPRAINKESDDGELEPDDF